MNAFCDMLVRYGGVYAMKKVYSMTLLNASKKPMFSILLLLTVLCVFTGCEHKQNSDYDTYSVELKEEISVPNMVILERCGKSLRGKIGDIPFMMLRGSYQEIGEAYGELVGGKILQLLNNVVIPFVNRDNRDLWDNEVIPKARTAVFPERYEIELAAMLTGIRNRFPNKEDRIVKLIDREITADDLRAINCLLDIFLMDNCSSFSAWGPFTDSGEVICGRNLDWRTLPVGRPFMVIAREPNESGRSATIDINAPGIIGTSTAMNADGMVFMAHYESGLPAPASEQWIPRALVIRDAIESTSTNDSISQIAELFKNKRVRIGNSTHIALQKHRHSFVVEWDGSRKDDGVTIRSEDPSVIKDAIVCTNHFVERRPGKLKASGDSLYRFGNIVDWLQRFRLSNQVIDIKAAVTILDSVAASGAKTTYISLIGIPAERKLFLAVSPGEGIAATKGKWVKFTWDQIFNAL